MALQLLDRGGGEPGGLEEGEQRASGGLSAAAVYQLTGSDSVLLTTDTPHELR